MRRESRDLASEAAKDARALIPSDTPRADMGPEFAPSEDEYEARLEKHFDKAWQKAAANPAPPTYHKSSSHRIGGKQANY
jgi:hypothetical protein